MLLQQQYSDYITLPMKRFIKLLARLENKSGSKWLDFYEDNTYRTPTYYCTYYNGGKDLGADKKEAAAQVVSIAQKIGGLKLLDITNIKE